ncbi:MAG: M28 family peptidase [bacterium]
MRILRLALVASSLLFPAALTAQGAPPVPVIVQPPAITLPLKHAPQPTSAAITAADLMTRLYIFADDSMMGREAGTLGNKMGTDYIAAEAKRFGLIPAGDNGTYFQTIPFKSRTLAAGSTITVGGASLAGGTDWVPTAKVPSGTLQVVFGGVIGDGSARATPEQAAGKFVVYKVLPQGLPLLQNPATFTPGIKAIAFVGLDQYFGYFTRPTMFVDDPEKTAADTAPPVLLVSATAFPKLFENASALVVGAEGHPATMAATITVEPVPFPARNVVGILPGSDAKLKNEYVAVGAHNDHIGISLPAVDHDSIRIFNHIVRPLGAEDMGKQADSTQQAQVNTLLAQWHSAHPGNARADSISNGADDDGSGSVTVLEIAENMAAMKTKPKRSTLFVWHVGEEKGLLGSAYFTDHPTVPRDSIVGQLNIDMVGRGDAWDVTGVSKDGAPLHGGENYLQLVGSRRLSTELGDLIDRVNRDTKAGFAFDTAMDANGHPMNIYCRSDHYEYARYGIPIVFFTTGGHSDYHQVTDEPQYINYPHMARVGQLVANAAIAVGNLDHRLVVDQPKPDPKGSCKQ